MHPYLAENCSYTSNFKGYDGRDGDDDENNNDDDERRRAIVSNQEEGEEEVVGGRDTEKQRVEIMTLADVRRAVMDGRFVEVQWSNTVALAMLHYSALSDGGG